MITYAQLDEIFSTLLANGLITLETYYGVRVVGTIEHPTKLSYPELAKTLNLHDEFYQLTLTGEVENPYTNEILMEFVVDWLKSLNLYNS